ncbi:MAG: hypothetical protein JW791_05495 [Nanoarchaeota archaeon]|nr:hypothetical protein [Nanoarchaeota archaeon]
MTAASDLIKEISSKTNTVLNTKKDFCIDKVLNDFKQYFEDLPDMPEHDFEKVIATVYLNLGIVQSNYADKMRGKKMRNESKKYAFQALDDCKRAILMLPESRIALEAYAQRALLYSQLGDLKSSQEELKKQRELAELLDSN